MEDNVDYRAKRYSSPISRLSQDILGYIFILNAEDPSGQAKYQLKLVLSISCVCKLWRQIVSKYPTLWSHAIDYNGSPTRVRKLLGLSRQSPLRVEILAFSDDDDGRNEKILELLFDHIPRLQFFGFFEIFTTRGAKKSWSMIKTKLLPHPAPHLTYLRLQRYPISSSPINLIETPPFDDHAPALRTVHLDGCLIPLNLCPGLLGGLSELQVRGINPFPSAETPSLDNWVQILKLSPQLQYLAIVNSISHPSTSVRNSSVSLNRLRMLYVQAPQQYCAELLHAVDIPAECGVRFEACIYKNGEYLEPLYYLMSQRILPSAHVSERWCKIQCMDNSHGSGPGWILFVNRARDSDAGDYFCEGWKSPDDESSSGKSDPFVCLNLLVGKDVQGDMSRLYAMLLDSFAPTYPSTTTLIISPLCLSNNHRSVLQRSIIDRLHLFRKLKRLELFDMDNDTHPCFTTLINPRSNAILLPSLREIQFNCPFSADLRLTELFEFIRYRKAWGLSIRKVKLNGVDVDTRVFESEIGEAMECLDRSGVFDSDEL